MLPMGLTEKHLAEGETVVMTLRTHMKAVFVPLLILLLLVVVVVAVWWLGPDNPILAWGTLGVATVAAVIWVVIPHLRWLTTEYTVTTKRISMRSGIVTRVGRDIPLYRINDVTYEKDLLDRMLGCGTLVISDASDGPGLTLHDVPHVEDVQVRLHELLFAHDDGSDDGEWPPTEPPRR